MQYIVRFVSTKSGVGKTTVASKIVELLRSKGFVIGVIKHCSSGVSLSEKDTEKYLRSGAIIAIAASPGLSVAYSSGFVDTLENALSLVNTPLVIVEGYRESKIGDAVVVSDSIEEAEKLISSFSNPIAVVITAGETELDSLNNIPVFKTGEEEKLAELIEKKAVEKLLEKTGKLNCQVCGYPTCKNFVEAYLKGIARWCPVSTDVVLVVDGVHVPLNPFVKNLIRSLVHSLLDSLKGVPRTRKRVALEILE